jgi:hypothetical protein
MPQRGFPPLGQEPQREQRLTGQVADVHEVQAEQDQADVSDVLKVMDLHQRLGAALSSGSPAASVARPRWTGAKNAGFLCINLWMACAEQHLPSVYAEECWGFPARDSL